MLLIQLANVKQLLKWTGDSPRTSYGSMKKKQKLKNQSYVSVKSLFGCTVPPVGR